MSRGCLHAPYPSPGRPKRLRCHRPTPTQFQAHSLNKHPSHSHAPPARLLHLGLASMSLQMITALNLMGSRGGGILYRAKKKHPTREQTRAGSFSRHNGHWGRTKKEVSWGVGGQGQRRYYFQISSHEKAREVPSPCPTAAGLLRPGLRPTALPGCTQPRAVPPDSCLAFNMKASHRMLSNTETGCHWRTCPLKLAVFLPHPFSPRPQAEPTVHDKELWHSSNAIKTHYSIFTFIPRIIWEFKCWICVPLIPALTVSLTTRSFMRSSAHTHGHGRVHAHVCTDTLQTPGWPQGREHYKSTQREAQFQILWQISCSLWQIVLNLRVLFNCCCPWRDH